MEVLMLLPLLVGLIGIAALAGVVWFLRTRRRPTAEAAQTLPWAEGAAGHARPAPRIIYPAVD